MPQLADHRTVNRATGLSKVALHRMHKNGILKSPEGQPGTGNPRGYTPATFTAALVMATVNEMGIGYDCMTLMHHIQDLPGFKGRGKRTDGYIKIHFEDFPKFLMYDGRHVVEGDQVVLGRPGFLVIDLHFHVAMMVLQTRLEAAPEAERLDTFEAARAMEGPLGDAARKLEVEMARGDITVTDAARLLGIDEDAIRAARIESARMKARAKK